MSNRFGAYVVWHSHEYIGTPYLVITNYRDGLTQDLIEEHILTADFEPGVGESLDTINLEGVWLVQDGMVTQCGLAELINAFDPDTFALMGWRPGDVQSHRPGWTDEQCREWLEANAKHLQDRLSELGNQVIEDLLPPAEYCIEWCLKGNTLYVDLFKENEEEPELSWNQEFTYREGTSLVASREHFASSFIDNVARSYGVSQDKIVQKQPGEDQF